MRIKTIVLTAVLSIMCIFTLAGCQKKIHLEEKSFTAETEIKTIVIDDESMDIEFSSSSTAKNITVDYYESSEYPLDVSVVLSSSTLRIKRNVKHTTFTPDYTWQYGCKTVVTLPEEYDGEIEVDILNGDITVNAITAGEVDFNTTNGDIILKTVTFKESKLNITNGKVNVSASTLDSLEVEVTNGDIQIFQTSISNKLKTDLTNGNHLFENVSAVSYDLNTTNGDFNLKRIECTALVNVKVVTGSVSISMKGAKEEYKTALSTGAGKTKGETSEGTKIITVKTTVGDITISYLG